MRDLILDMIVDTDVQQIYQVDVNLKTGPEIKPVHGQGDFWIVPATLICCWHKDNAKDWEMSSAHVRGLRTDRISTGIRVWYEIDDTMPLWVHVLVNETKPGGRTSQPTGEEPS